MKVKLFIAAFAAVVFAAGFVSCSKKTNSTIGISKFVAHPALDAVEKGIVDRLESSGRGLKLNLQNAAADMSTVSQIAMQFKNENVLAAVGIATPSAQALANNLKDIPVVFSAVTDPVGAALVDTIESGKENVTGASDAINVKAHIEIFKDTANIKTLGYIYTSSEDNSNSSLKDVQSACNELGIELVVQAITNSAELNQAAQSIINRIDGIYITNDNVVYSAWPALVKVCRDGKKPLFSCDVTSCLEGGAFIALGWDYYKIGLATGDIVLEILDGKKPAEIPVRFLDPFTESDFLIDLDEAERCGINVPERYLSQANKIFKNGTLTEK